MDFNAGHDKVIDFMGHVKAVQDQRKADEDFRNSDKYKLRVLDNEQKKANGVCLDLVFSKLYKDAIPLNDDYKVAYGDDLDADIHDFIHDRCPNGMEYYIREAIKKGSKPAKDIYESVCDITGNFFMEKSLKIEECDPDDLVFRSGEDTQQKIDAMNKDLALDDVTSIIRDNVKSSAISEITRAKKEKQEIQNLENEMTNDMKIKTESAIDDYLELKGVTEKKTFNPTLFQGIMIGKVNELTAMQESGKLQNQPLYNTLVDYGMVNETSESSIEEMAFVESVKELTKINLLSALCLEKYSKQDIEDMANEYAYTIK